MEAWGRGLAQYQMLTPPTFLKYYGMIVILKGGVVTLSGQYSDPQRKVEKNWVEHAGLTDLDFDGDDF